MRSVQRIRKAASCILVLVACNVSTWSVHAFQSSPVASHKQQQRPSVTTARARRQSDDTIDPNTIAHYVATAIPGTAGILADELSELGCHDVTVSGNAAVTFGANLTTALRILLEVRCALKILELLCESEAPIETRDDVYQFCRNSVNIQDLLGNGQGGLLTLSVTTKLVGRNIPSDINHSHYTSLTIKNALCDAVRDLRGDRPNVNLDDPDVPLVAMIRGMEHGAKLSLYRQLHTASLHVRGYRDGIVHKAALKPTLAAALLRQAGWKEKCEIAWQNGDPLYLLDPCCGSGTFLLEAAMMAADLAPGLMRIKCGVPSASMPPIVRWKHDDNGDKTKVLQLWKGLLLEATQRARTGLQWLKSSQIRLLGNDIHPGALELCERAMCQAGLDNVIELHNCDCRDWQPPVIDHSPSWFVVSNPPWDVRMDDDHNAWEGLRVFLRQTCPPNTQVYVLSGNRAATKHLGLRKSASLPVQTGEQDLRWIHYVIRDKTSPTVGDDSSSTLPTENETKVSKQPPRRKASTTPPRRRKEDAANAWLLD